MIFDYPTNLLNHWMPLGCEWVYFSSFLTQWYEYYYNIAFQRMTKRPLHCAPYFKIFGMQYRNVCMIFVSFECKKELKIFNAQMFSKKSNKNDLSLRRWKDIAVLFCTFLWNNIHNFLRAFTSCHRRKDIISWSFTCRYSKKVHSLQPR